MKAETYDVWAAGAAYESYVGRWSRLVARDFLTGLRVAPRSDWLDIGCGTGALVKAIITLAEPRRIEAVDSSDAFVNHARRHIPDPRAAFIVADARALPQRDASMDYVVSGLTLNFVPQPSSAVAEMARVAKPGTGVVAVYVWDYADRMEIMRYFWNAAIAQDSRAESLDEGRRFPICKPEPLATLFRDAGLRDVAVRPIDVRTKFRSFDDYWTPFLGGQGPAPGYAMSLDEERRAELREALRRSLPVAPNGSIDLVARAWSIHGVRAPA
jgi:trans-aconitate methyltransferase